MRGTSAAALSRRSFVKTFALASAAVLGRAGFAAPSDRIGIGIIGCGGRAGGYGIPGFLHAPDARVVAVCDVDRGKREAARNRVNAHYNTRDCTAHRDLRELLARDGVDAVYIATGDRWHTSASLLAMAAGKDVYCEKPCSLTLEESRALRDGVRRHRRIFQAGTQRRSEEPFVFAHEAVRRGALGRVHTLRADVPSRTNWKLRPVHEDLPGRPAPAPGEFDWDLFLGPLPWRDYNPAYKDWHGRADFYGGTFTEWATHTYDLCMWPLELDRAAATSYTPAGTPLGNGLVAAFPNGVRMIAADGGWPHPCRADYEGDEGRIIVGDGLLDVQPRSLLEHRKRWVAEYRARTGRPLHHIGDFLQCIRTRRDPITHADICHAVHATCHAATLSWLLNRPLTWDPAREAFVGDEEANRLRRRARREPWHL